MGEKKREETVGQEGPMSHGDCSRKSVSEAPLPKVNPRSLIATQKNQLSSETDVSGGPAFEPADAVP